MKIGVDFYGTITKHPELFNKLLNGIEHEFYIVSAVREYNVERLLRNVQKYNLDVKIEPVIYVEFSQVPHLKLHTAQKLGLEMFIDDRRDTIELMSSVGILGLLII